MFGLLLAACGGSRSAAQATLPPVPASLPPLPSAWPASTLQLGLTDPPGDAASLQQSAPFGLRYAYLAGGVNTGAGWTTWQPNDGYVGQYVRESAANGLMPVFSYYLLRQSLPGAKEVEAKGDADNLEDVATMTAYWQDLTRFFRAAGATNTTIVLHVEPDLWGYAEQRAKNNDASTVAVKVAATGNADLAGLPDTLTGFAQAILRLRDRYAPNVLLAYHLSVWGTGVAIAETDPSDAKVDALAGQAAGFYASLNTNFDLVFGEFSDRDAGYNQVVGHDGGASWWDAGDFTRHVRFLSDFVQATGKRIVLWQIPLGNRQLDALDNTTGHYQDNRVEWLLDDPTGAHLAAYRDAGVIALLFGGGSSETTCACDAEHDGVTNPPPIDGNKGASLSADDDGGFFRAKAAAYYAAGALPLAAGQTPHANAEP